MTSDEEKEKYAEWQYKDNYICILVYVYGYK